jgi:hypothetical protein
MNHRDSCLVKQKLWLSGTDSHSLVRGARAAAVSAAAFLNYGIRSPRRR